MFPLIALAAGVREGLSAVEASIQLSRLAGAGNAAVICSILDDDGEMARLEDVAPLVTEFASNTVEIDALLGIR